MFHDEYESGGTDVNCSVRIPAGWHDEQNFGARLVYTVVVNCGALKGIDKPANYCV